MFQGTFRASLESSNLLIEWEKAEFVLYFLTRKHNDRRSKASSFEFPRQVYFSSHQGSEAAGGGMRALTLLGVEFAYVGYGDADPSNVSAIVRGGA